MARVKANSYGDGTVYLGGNKFKNPDGNISEVFGYFTSPSGKRTYTNKDGEILILKSSDIFSVGSIIQNNEFTYQPSEVMTENEIYEEAKKMAGDKPVEDFFFDAARKLGGPNKAVKE